MASTSTRTSTGDASADALVSACLALLDAPMPAGRARHVVALAGRPASGKTSLASAVCALVNAARPGACCCVPMDGFHRTRAQLDASEDPALAHAKRGAHWTFDAAGFCAAVARVATDAGVVALPGWSHVDKDPAPGAVRVAPEHRLVLVEGLYVLLDEPAWREGLQPWLSLRWLLACDAAEAARRGAVRNWRAGICDTLEASEARWADNDTPNGDLVEARVDRARLDAIVTQEQAAAVIAAAAALTQG